MTILILHAGEFIPRRVKLVENHRQTAEVAARQAHGAIEAERLAAVTQQGKEISPGKTADFYFTISKK
jgi:hypothetical protein